MRIFAAFRWSIAPVNVILVLAPRFSHAREKPRLRDMSNSKYSTCCQISKQEWEHLFAWPSDFILCDLKKTEKVFIYKRNRSYTGETEFQAQLDLPTDIVHRPLLSRATKPAGTKPVDCCESCLAALARLGLKRSQCCLRK